VGMKIPFQAEVAWIKPKGSTSDTVRLVHRMNSMYKIWTIDTEFSIARGTTSTPFAISIRDAQTNDSILRTAVDYNRRTLQPI
jgi:hypothetical protein